MSTNLTLKNIPDSVYESLKASAQLNRRSMNSEAIVCLEAALQYGKQSPEASLSKAQALRQSLATKKFNPKTIDAFKRKGRA